MKIIFVRSEMLGLKCAENSFTIKTNPLPEKRYLKNGIKLVWFFKMFRVHDTLDCVRFTV